MNDEPTTAEAITTSLLTSLVPRSRSWASYEIAAQTRPVEEVGGDYHDVIADPGGDGLWIAIADVAGHGLKAGLIALMVESIVLGLIHARPDILPLELVTALNRALHENIRVRLQSDDFVTFAIMRCRDDGSITMSGAHEDVLIWRHATGRCETIALPGVWLGLTAHVEGHLTSASTQLAEGDLLLLHTDGLTEAVGTDGRAFGPDRLVAMLEARGTERPEAVAQAMMGGAASESDDDMTLVIARYRSRGASPSPIRL